MQKLGFCGIIGMFLTSNTASAAEVCGSHSQSPSYNTSLYLACKPGEQVDSIQFAAFGTPTGSCSAGWHSDPTCNASFVSTAVQELCVGAVGCDIPVDPRVIGFPDDSTGCKAGQTRQLAVSLSCGPAKAPQPPIDSVQWGITTIPLRAEQVHLNPLQDVRVNVTFKLQDDLAAPTSRQLVRPAYWDGGGSWKVRFAPPVPGQWKWTSASSAVEDAGLHGVSGALKVQPPSHSQEKPAGSLPGVVVPGAPLSTKGPVAVDASKRHFSHRGDGSPFFWLGDTHWQMPDWEHLVGCNAPSGTNCSSQFEYLLQSRRQGGFSVYQTYFKGDEAHWWLDAGAGGGSEKGWAWLAPSRFREVADPMMNAISEAGLLLAMGIGLHHMSVEVPTDRLARLGEYVVARYGAHPIVWITAQEVNSPQSNASAWEQVAAAMARADAPGHASPLSAHMWPFVSESNHTNPYTYGEQPWHSWFATQGGHTGLGIRPQSHYKGYQEYIPRQPFLEAEAMYEDIICGPRFAHANDTRRAAYKAMQCGSLGYTYGAAAVWLFKWNQTDPRGAKYNPDPMWWWPGMHLPGAGQMGILRALYDGGLQLQLAGTQVQGGGHVSWTQLVPQFGGSTMCGGLADIERTPVSATADGGTILLYAYGDSVQLGSLHGLAAGTQYGGEWVDVRTGARAEAWGSGGRGTVGDAGALALPNKPTASDDWALLLVRLA